MTGIDDFYSADNLETKDSVVADINNFTGTDALSQRFGYLRNGSWVRAVGSSWVVQADPTDFEELIYPNNVNLPIGEELGASQFAATTSYSITGKTPVPIRVA
jgi:hypothetical protein